MVSGRLILDQAGLGAWNMAVDQALLETAEQTGLATLRFYQWSKPTLSLGYFQRYAERNQHSPSLECDLVRRASGGGAILHDREITYSLCIPSSNRWSRRNSELYDVMHAAIVDLLKGHGLDARLYGELEESDGHAEIDDKAFLCFQRRTDRDIVVGPHKVCGSAQRRLKNSVIQHGSLLMSKSEFAPELMGLGDLVNEPIEQRKMCQQLAQRVAHEMAFELSNSQLSESEFETAESIARDRFLAPKWTTKR